MVCAYKIPDQLNKVGIVSGMLPYDFPKSKKGKAMLIPRLPACLQSMLLKNMNNMVRNTPEKIKNSITKSLPDVDRQILKRPEKMHVFLEAIQEAFKKNHMGALQDAKIYKSDWGFALSDVRPQLFVWHGEKDLNVRIASAKYLTNMLPNCVSKFYPTEGHISLIFNHIKEILELLSTNNRI